MTLDLAIRAMLKDVVREVMREEGLASKPSQVANEFLTYAEAAELAHVSVATIKRWVRLGRLKALGEGRVRRVLSDDVRQCLLEAAPVAKSRKQPLYPAELWDRRQIPGKNRRFSGTAPHLLYTQFVTGPQLAHNDQDIELTARVALTALSGEVLR